MNEQSAKELIGEQIMEHYESLYRLAYSYVQQEQDAMDIVQESAYKALKSHSAVRQPEYIRTWLYRIVMNTSVDFLRKRNREVVGIEDDQSYTEDAYGDADLMELLNMLEPRERAILILRYFEDRKLEEIAEILKENLNTVKTILYRSLKKLKLEFYAEWEGAR